MQIEILPTLTHADQDLLGRALILTGTGRGFCAGADLAGRNQPPEPEPEGAPKRDSGSSIEETWNPLARKLAVIMHRMWVDDTKFLRGKGAKVLQKRKLTPPVPA